MTIEHTIYLDTPATRHELRDTLVQAGIGFEAGPDFGNTSGAFSAATNVTILDGLDDRTGRSDNGVVENCSVTFHDLRKNSVLFELETVRGVMALLDCYSTADAYWEAYDARRPMLLRRGGQLVLARMFVEPENMWDSERERYPTLRQLPYQVEHIGTWPIIAA